MYDKEFVLDILEQIIEAIVIVQERCTFATCQNDFMDTKEGQEKLDSICMKLIAIGESLKNIDKITDKHKWGQATFMELDNKSFTCK